MRDAGEVREAGEVKSGKPRKYFPFFARGGAMDVSPTGPLSFVGHDFGLSIWCLWCLWCLRVFVDVCGCLWVFAGVLGRLQAFANVCGSFAQP